MNSKRGNMWFGVWVGIFIYIIGVLFIPYITDDITTTREALDCSSTDITGGTMLTCLQIDLVLPYLIWFFVSLALGFVAGGLS